MTVESLMKMFLAFTWPQVDLGNLILILRGISIDLAHLRVLHVLHVRLF